LTGTILARSTKPLSLYPSMESQASRLQELPTQHSPYLEQLCFQEAVIW